MKNTKAHILGICTLALTVLAAPMAGLAADEAPAKKLKPYPLVTCLVSGEKLGEMGKPHVVSHNGQEIKFCCKDCVKSFNKDPEKYLKKLDNHGKKHGDHEGHKGHNH
jgi:YHS domain-containing protein